MPEDLYGKYERQIEDDAYDRWCEMLAQDEEDEEDED